MILLFDTSTPTGLLLVGDSGCVLASSTWSAEQSHSQKLPPQIRLALETTGITFADLTHIAVGVGPGSFTGLRVALATAKGLGIALKLPIVAIPSLEFFAAGIAIEDVCIASTTDAFRGEIYLGIYEKRGAALSTIGEVCSLRPGCAIEAIRAIGKPVVVTGTGYRRYPSLFDAVFPPHATEGPRFPGILRLAEHHVLQGRIIDPAAVLPYYVREAEAVEKKKVSGVIVKPSG